MGDHSIKGNQRSIGGEMRGENKSIKNERVRHDVTLLTDQDIYLFKEGNHFNLYHKLGSHHLTTDGIEGTYFAVWAPDAENVFVMGDFSLKFIANEIKVGLYLFLTSWKGAVLAMLLFIVLIIVFCWIFGGCFHRDKHA